MKDESVQKNSNQRLSDTDDEFFVDANVASNDRVDLPRIEAAVREILSAVGEDCWRLHRG